MRTSAKASTPATSGAIRSAREVRPLLEARTSLDEDHVVLLLHVGGLDLHGDGLADEVAQLGEARGLLVEEEVDHLLGREDAVFLGVELPVGAKDLAQHLVADGAGGLQLPATLAHGARFAQD